MKDPIVQIDSPVLHQVAKPVAKKDFGSRPLAALIKKMKITLAKEEFGVALAAPQVGESLRLFVVSEKVFVKQKIGKRATDHESSSPKERAERFSAQQPTVFINPKITRLSRKKREMSEGCLSVRGKYGTVVRHEKASIKAHDEHGREFVYHGSGLLAHVFQHECDHLEGVMYTDKAKKLQDDESRTELRAKFPA